MTCCGLMVVGGGRQSDPAIERAHVKIGREIRSLEKYRLDLPSRSISALPDQHKIAQVDLLNFDVEGFDRQVRLDFQSHRPCFILVEARFRENIDAIVAALRSHRATIAS